MKNNKFKLPIKTEIKNYLTDENYTLYGVDGFFEVSDDDFGQIARICNESAIYEFLFREKFDGREYDIEDARGFIA